MREFVLFLCLCLTAFADSFSNGALVSGGFHSNPTWFVDSLGGSDVNSGIISTAPLATLGALSSKLISSTTSNTILLKRGSTFAESFEIPTNSYIGVYGVGAKPIITGTTNLANNLFTLASGWTNTYQYTLTVARESNKWINVIHTNVLMVWQNGVRLGFLWSHNAGFGSTTNVEANVGSFWYDTANSILYIHARTNSNPITDGFQYEASVRTLALHGGMNFTVEDIEARYCYAFNTLGNQGYQALGHSDGVYRRCVLHGGWNHVAGVANSLLWTNIVFDSCKIYDGDPDAGPVLCIAYDDTPAPPYPLVTWTNCLVYQPAESSSSATVGFLAHGGAIRSKIQNCTCTNLGSAYSLLASDALLGRGIIELSDCKAIRCVTTLPTLISNYTINNLQVYNPQGNSIIVLDGNQASGGIANSKFVNDLDVNIFTINQTTNPWTVGFTNCVFGSSNGAAQLFVIGGGLNVRFVSNTFYNFFRCFSGASIPATNISYSDYNNFYNNTTLASTLPTNLSTFTAWTNAYPQFDRHSVTTNPSYSSVFFTSPLVSDPTTP